MSDTGFTPPPPPPPSAGAGGEIPPRGLGDILTTAWELYRTNAAKMIGIVAIVVVPFTLLTSLLVNVVFAPTVNEVLGVEVKIRTGFAALMASVVGFAIFFIMSYVVQAAVTRAAAQATVGDPVDIQESYRWGFTRLGPVLVVSLLSGLIIFGGLLLLFIPGLIFAIFLAVAIPALVVEDLHGTAAIGRSWNLVKGNFWHVLGTIIVAGLITGVIGAIFTAIGGDNFFLSWIFGSIGSVLTVPFSALVAVLLYVDLRVKSESLTGNTLRGEIARNV